MNSASLVTSDDTILSESVKRRRRGRPRKPRDEFGQIIRGDDVSSDHATTAPAKNLHAAHIVKRPIGRPPLPRDQFGQIIHDDSKKTQKTHHTDNRKRRDADPDWEVPADVPRPKLKKAGWTPPTLDRYRVGTPAAERRTTTTSNRNDPDWAPSAVGPAGMKSSKPSFGRAIGSLFGRGRPKLLRDEYGRLIDSKTELAIARERLCASTSESSGRREIAKKPVSREVSNWYEKGHDEPVRIPTTVPRGAYKKKKKQDSTSTTTPKRGPGRPRKNESNIVEPAAKLLRDEQGNVIHGTAWHDADELAATTTTTLAVDDAQVEKVQRSEVDDESAVEVVQLFHLPPDDDAEMADESPGGGADQEEEDIDSDGEEKPTLVDEETATASVERELDDIFPPGIVRDLLRPRRINISAPSSSSSSTSCESCWESFADCDALAQHRQRHVVLILISCRLCKKSLRFVNACAFHSHLLEHARRGERLRGSKSHVTVHRLPGGVDDESGGDGRLSFQDKCES